MNAVPVVDVHPVLEERANLERVLYEAIAVETPELTAFGCCGHRATGDGTVKGRLGCLIGEWQTGRNFDRFERRLKLLLDLFVWLEMEAVATKGKRERLQSVREFPERH